MVAPATTPTGRSLRSRNQDRVRNPIDAFILEKLERQGLEPAPEADKRTLIRRASFDLTGLPPTPEQVDRCLKDSSPNAYDKLVRDLLASPRYGERWARHWLDLVRYADSGGYETDEYFPNSWRYRDYVIKSLNENKPYDRFLQEQIAGDELWPDDLETSRPLLRHHPREAGAPRSPDRPPASTPSVRRSSSPCSTPQSSPMRG